MSTFTSPLIVELGDDGWFTLRESFSYYTNLNPDYFTGKSPDRIINTIKIVKATSGTRTDFASIPRFMRAVYSPTDPRWGKAAVIHDFMLRNALYSLPYANAIFNEGMQVLKCENYIRLQLYLAVKLFGRGSYK